MDLSDLVSSHCDRILGRWTERVRGTLHPASMPRLELVDHLPIFLAEVGEALRLRESTSESPIAAQHGVQRLALGFSLDSVVREYGVLRDAILEEAAAEGVVIDTRERVRRNAGETPVLLKIAPDLSLDELDDVVQVARKRKVDGMIVANTTLSRPPGLREQVRPFVIADRPPLV